MTENNSIENIMSKVYKTLIEGKQDRQEANITDNYAPGLIMSRGYQNKYLYNNTIEPSVETELTEDIPTPSEILNPSVKYNETTINNFGIRCTNNTDRELIILFLDLIGLKYNEKTRAALSPILNLGTYDITYKTVDFDEIKDNKEILVIYYNEENAKDAERNNIKILKNITIQTHNSYIKTQTNMTQHPVTQFISSKKLMFNIRKHYLIPRYIKLLNNEEENEVMEKYNINKKNQMPKIYGLYTTEKTTSPIARVDPLCEFYGFYTNNLIKIVNREGKLSYRYILSNFQYLTKKLDLTMYEDIKRYDDNLKAGQEIGIFETSDTNIPSDTPSDTSGRSDSPDDANAIGDFFDKLTDVAADIATDTGEVLTDLGEDLVDAGKDLGEAVTDLGDNY